MRKINFALISDSVFVALCAFLLVFTVARFYLRSAVWALVCAVAVALAVGAFAFWRLFRKRGKKLALSLNEREKKSLALHLSVCGESEIIRLFQRALDGTYAAGNRLESEECVYLFFFRLSPLSPDDVAEAIKTRTDKKKVIFCCVAGQEALSLADDFSVGVRQIGEVYATLKEKDLLPEKYALGEVKKIGLWRRIRKRFNRRICPSLFFCGLSLLFFSYFTFYPVYYVVAGGILLTLSAVSLLFGQPSGM